MDIWDVRQLGTGGTGTPQILRSLRSPPSSGEVSCVAAFPDGKHIAWCVDIDQISFMPHVTVCSASQDNIRLWNVHEGEDIRAKGAQFKIITGHHGGHISQIRMSRL